MSAIKKIALSLITLSGAYGLLYVIRQSSLLKNTQVKVIGVKKLSSSNLKQTNLEFTLAIKNNSDIGFFLTGQSYNLLIGTRAVGAASSDDQIDLKAHAEAFTTVRASIYHGDVLSATGRAMAEILGNLANLKFTIDGRISGKTGFLLISRFPIKITLKLSEVL